MAYIFSRKIDRRGRKVIDRPTRIRDISFTDEFAEMYDEISHNWREKAEALRKRRESSLKFL